MTLGAAPPWVAAPTPAQMVRTSEAIARASSSHATQCWLTLLASVEAAQPLQQPREALRVALANQAYAWAVYHAAVADASSPTELGDPVRDVDAGADEGDRAG